MTETPQATNSQTIAGIIFGVAMIFCGMEMVPGWGFLHVGWPTWTYYVIMAVAGAIAGPLFATDHPLPGLVGGLVAGPGAIFAVAQLLAHVNSTLDIVIAIVGGLGTLPGFALYKILAKLEDAVTDPPRTVAPETQSLFDPTKTGK